MSDGTASRTHACQGTSFVHASVCRDCAKVVLLLIIAKIGKIDIVSGSVPKNRPPTTLRDVFAADKLFWCSPSLLGKFLSWWRLHVHVAYCTWFDGRSSPQCRSDRAEPRRPCGLLSPLRRHKTLFQGRRDSRRASDRTTFRIVFKVGSSAVLFATLSSLAVVRSSRHFISQINIGPFSNSRPFRRKHIRYIWPAGSSDSEIRIPRQSPLFEAQLIS